MMTKSKAPKPPPAQLQPASDSEKNLSGSLITSALGLLAAFLWASFGILDKVKPVGQWIISGIGLVAAIALVASVVFGGIGIARGVRPGPGNAFDRQAKAGLFGVSLLFLGPPVALTWRDAPSDTGASQGNVQQLRSDLSLLRDNMQRDLAAHQRRLDEIEAASRDPVPTQSSP